MIDQAHINLPDLIPTKLRKVSGSGELHGPCPFCGGKDRFCLQKKVNGWIWICRQCSRHGDPIAFIRDYNNVTFAEACAMLGLQAAADQPPAAHRPDRRSALPEPPVHAGDLKDAECFAIAWQQGAYSFTEQARELLQNQWGKKSSAYLEARGIDRRTAQYAGLGINPESHSRQWGETKVWLPRGIVIPWDIEWELWNVRIRRPQADIENGGDKYMSPRGVANGLYIVRPVVPGQPVIMVEGEFDALIVAKETRALDPQPAVVSIASNTGSRLLRWVTMLALASRVILAFDDDTAGDNAADYWSMALPKGKTTRLRPAGGKDATEIYENDRGVLQWLMGALVSGEGVR